MKPSTVLGLALVTVLFISGVLSEETTTEEPGKICSCPKINDPVCGTNGITYGNACVLDCEARRSVDEELTVAHRGECPKPDEVKTHQ